MYLLGYINLTCNKLTHFFMYINGSFFFFLPKLRNGNSKRRRSLKLPCNTHATTITHKYKNGCWLYKVLMHFHPHPHSALVHFTTTSTVLHWSTCTWGGICARQLLPAEWKITLGKQTDFCEVVLLLCTARFSVHNLLYVMLSRLIFFLPLFLSFFFLSAAREN